MAKKKQSKIDSAIAKLDDESKQKVRQEIKSIKIQYIIAILTIIGSAISFIVLQQQKIKDIFKKDPVISIVCQDELVRRSARITIVNVNDSSTFESDLKNLREEQSLPAGSYYTTITFNDKVIWTERFMLRSNQVQVIQLPDFFHNKINLYVKNQNAESKPKGRIDLEINSSGNGFLWIYQLDEAGKPVLLFPSAEETSLNHNQIAANAPFNFPENTYLAAGDKEGIEKYVFLATSINDAGYADQVLHSLYPTDINKGSMESLEKNWGVSIMDVIVKR